MSKMSQLHAELMEQASELGFEDLGEAEMAGYEVDWDRQKLIPPEEAAHNAWLKERDEVFKGLISVYNDIDVPRDLKKNIKHAIDFIKKGEM